jgi:hypothetical protein
LELEDHHHQHNRKNQAIPHSPQYPTQLQNNRPKFRLEAPKILLAKRYVIRAGRFDVSV